MSARSVSFQVDGLRYAGLQWGDPTGPVVIGLHGWLDNALSFSILAPLLPHYRFIALDLSGQGISDHRSADATYQIWDDVPQLVGIVNQLGVESVRLVGHSRGAAIAVLLGSVLQERCTHLALLDGLLPTPIDEALAPGQLQNAIAGYATLAAKASRQFAAIDDYVVAREKLGFSSESARLLAPRALQQTPEGWMVRHDPRLNAPSPVKLTDGMREAFYRSLSARVCVIMAQQGMAERDFMMRSLQVAKDLMPQARFLEVPGSHHAHMEEGAGSVAAQLADFWLAY